MPKVTKDGNFTMIRIPEKDMASLVRFVAHAVEKNPDYVIDFSQKIVRGDILKQDEYVSELANVLDVANWWIVLDGAESLQLCDELAETIYEEPAEGFGPALRKQKESHLRMVKICVDCQKGFVKGEPHDCENKK
jgi:hypothetical protein